MTAKRVLLAEFMHESNTFSIKLTGRQHFVDNTLVIGEDNILPIYTGLRSAIGAGIAAGERYGWEIITPLVAETGPSGVVVDSCFEEFSSIIVDACKNLDGILLHLHGSMSTQSYPDGEGELLSRIRAAAGKDVPIMVVLDLHATVTDQMAENSNVLLSYRTYPHIDQFERMTQAAELMDRTLRGEIAPVVVVARKPILYALDGGRTNSPPMMELLRRADVIEANGDAYVVSIQAGFSSADVHDIGPSVAVAAKDHETATRIADQLMDYVWENRHYSSIHFTDLSEAMARAKENHPGEKPLIISDYSDNPGSGAYGDATTLLKTMLDANLQNVVFYAICDPEAALLAQKAGVGNTLTLKLGCKIDPKVGGGPLEVTAHVVTLTDGRFIAYGPMGSGEWRNYGLSALLRVGGIEIVIISANGQATDVAQVTSLGVDITKKSTIVVKSMQHFRAAFEPVAREVIEVDTGALSTKDFPSRPYQNVRRPIWPLDEI